MTTWIFEGGPLLETSDFRETRGLTHAQQKLFRGGIRQEFQRAFDQTYVINEMCLQGLTDFPLVR